MTFFYLSFCDTTLPEGQQFLGATVVDAADPKHAVEVATARGLNPGGEIALAAFGKVVPADAAHYVNKFVPRDVVLAEGGASVAEVGNIFDDSVCQKHNPVPIT